MKCVCRLRDEPELLHMWSTVTRKRSKKLVRMHGAHISMSRTGQMVSKNIYMALIFQCQGLDRLFQRMSFSNVFSKGLPGPCRPVWWCGWRIDSPCRHKCDSDAYDEEDVKELGLVFFTGKKKDLGNMHAGLVWRGFQRNKCPRWLWKCGLFIKAPNTHEQIWEW